MRIATVHVESLTPYSQSRAIESEKKTDETHDAFDRRIWPEHMHVDEDGQVFIPPVAIIQGMAAAASYLGKGGELKKKGAATWAQNFTCGLSVASGPRIGTKAEDARPERVYCNADGKRGSGKRVWRTFPMFDKWESEFVIHILDDTIPEDIFERVARAFGLFMGVGRYRPQSGGYLGRFLVKRIRIEDA
jgi:hypothetical protein